MKRPQRQFEPSLSERDPAVLVGIPANISPLQNLKPLRRDGGQRSTPYAVLPPFE
jgi:hypothetical protein